MTENKVKPTISVQLDKPRNMALDLNAMIAYEKATGRSFLKGEVDLENIGLAEMRALLWAMLLTDDPTLTQEQVGGMITAGNIKQLAADLAIGLKAAMPEAAPEKPQDPR